MPQSPTQRSMLLIATGVSSLPRLQAPSQGCGQTRPIVAGKGLRFVMMCQPSVKDSEALRPYFSACAMYVMYPRMSSALGHMKVHGGIFST